MLEVWSLPFDAIYCILEWIGIEDIVNLGWTCKRLYITIWQPSNKLLLRGKFFQRWPSLENVCESLWHSRDIDIKKEIMQNLKCRQELLHCFTRYTRTILCSESGTDDMSDIDKLCCIKKCTCFKYYYVEDELMNILTRKDTMHNNLRYIYCAERIFSYIKYRRIMEKWHMFMHLPAEKQLLEIVAAYVTQHCRFQRHVFYAHISALLDGLVNQVLDFLKEQNPTHTVFSTSEVQFLFWRENNIEKHNWDMTETKQIIRAICNVMHNDFYMRYMDAEYPYEITGEDLTNCIIDTVLKYKRGNDICIAIIFQSVARRLGVRCDLMKFENGFFLYWARNYASPMFYSHYYKYNILLYRSSKYNTNIIERPDMTEISPWRNEFCYYKYSRMTPAELVLQLTCPSLFYNAQRNIMERLKIGRLQMLQMRHMVDPKDKIILRFLLLSHGVTVDRIYLPTFRIPCYALLDLSNRWNMLQKSLNAIEASFDRKDPLNDKLKKKISDALQRFERYQINMQYNFHHQEPKKRVKGLKYAVGMIVNTGISPGSDSHLGAIVGWDKVFNEEVLNLFDTSPRNKRIREAYSGQPCYIILSSHNMTLYISQDKVMPIINPRYEPINHDEIGRYFVYYETTHYLPNSILNTIYPDDADVRCQHIYNPFKRNKFVKYKRVLYETVDI